MFLQSVSNSSSTINENAVYATVYVFVAIFSFIFVCYFVYRVWAMASTRSPLTLNRALKPKILTGVSVLSDGARVESSILNPASTSNTIFFAIHSLSTKKEDFAGLATAGGATKHTTFLWTLRNFSPNMADTKFHIQTFTDDIIDLVSGLREKYPTKKIVFVGEAFGAMLLADMMKRYPGLNETSKFILINPLPNKETRLSSMVDRNLVNLFQLMYGFLGARNLLVQMKFEFNPTARRTVFAKMAPALFFSNFFILEKHIISNILWNKKSKVMIAYSARDLRSRNRFNSLKARLVVTNPNISFVAKDDLGLSLPKTESDQSSFFKSLITDFNKLEPKL